MDNASWSTFDNSSKTLDNVTIALMTISTQTVSTSTVAAVALVAMGIGSCANCVVLAVMFRARREFGGTVHTLITHQSVIDLLMCTAGMVTIIVMVTHGYTYNGNKIIDGAICLTS